MIWKENNIFIGIASNILEKLKNWLLAGEAIYEPKLVLSKYLKNIT